MVALGFLLLCLCWSTTWHAIRLCLIGYPPLLGAALRFLLATAILFAMLGIGQRKLGAAAMLPPRRRQHLALLGAGVANGLGYACIYLAEQTLSGGTTAVICASSPLFTALLARLMGLEPLRLRRILGMAVGFIGVSMLLAHGQQISHGHFLAMLLAGSAAALLWPLYGGLLKRYAQDLSPLLSSSYFLLYTAVTLLITSLLRAEPLPALHRLPWVAHAGLLYLTVVGSVLAWTVYLWLLKRLDLSVLATLGLIQPVLALGFDLLFNEAQLQPRGYIGAALVLAGMFLSTFPHRSEGDLAGAD